MKNTRESVRKKTSAVVKLTRSKKICDLCLHEVEVTLRNSFRWGHIFFFFLKKSRNKEKHISILEL